MRKALYRDAIVAVVKHYLNKRRQNLMSCAFLEYKDEI